MRKVNVKKVLRRKKFDRSLFIFFAIAGITAASLGKPALSVFLGSLSVINFFSFQVMKEILRRKDEIEMSKNNA